MDRRSNRAIGLVLRLAVAAVVLVVGSTAIYGFGAAYYSKFHLWLPRPWNVIVSVVLLIGLIWLTVRIVRGRKHPQVSRDQS